MLINKLSLCGVTTLFYHKDLETANPLDVNQWTFYMVKTIELDNKLPNQKTIGLSTLKSLEHIECSYDELKSKLNGL